MAGQAGATAAPKQLTIRDYIGQQAEQLGIPSSLAFAMVDQESDGQQSAVSPKGARGFFQLMPATAAELGVNPDDPFDNIRGGLTYFKQQLDAHKGDVRLALAAYNAGPGRTQTGAVPNIPETQDYVQRILQRWQQGDTPTAAPTATQPAASAQPPAARTPQPSGIAPANAVLPGAIPQSTLAGDPYRDPNAAIAPAPGVFESFDPRTFRGRVNWAATGAGILAGVATRNPQVATQTQAGIQAVAATAARTGIAPWILRVLGPPTAAGVASGGLAEAEVALGSAPQGTDPLATGVEQGIYEAAGGVLMWPIRRLGSAFVGSSVGRQAADALSERLDQTKAMARSTVEAVQDRIREARTALGLVQKATSAATRANTISAVQTLAGDVTQAGAPRTGRTIARIAQQELDDQRALAANERIYNDLLQQAPSRLGAGRTVTDTLTGPTRQAMRLAGQRVDEAAQDGPPLPLAPIQKFIGDLAARYRPAEIFGAEAAPAIGFGGPVAMGARPAGVATGQTISIEEFRKLARGAIDLENRTLKDITQLPGILGRVQQLPGDTIPYDVAHTLKMILDASINWSKDRTKAASMENLTKATRIELRKQLAGFAPYDDATAAYHAIMRLRGSDAGKRVLRLARTLDGPARLASMLQTGDAAQAQVLRSLLVDQAAAGGDAALGMQAWDAVREVYTYDKLIKGGLDGLSERVRKLVTENDEFARTVYHDVAGQKILTNLSTLGDAIRQITEGAGERRAAGMATLATTARRETRELQRAGQQAVTAARGTQDAFRKSSVGTQHTFEQKAADFLRALGLGPRSIWGALSIARLFESAKGPDLLRWAAYSDRNTQRVVRTLLGTWPERGLAAGVRSTGEGAGPAAETAPEINTLLQEMMEFTQDPAQSPTGTGTPPAPASTP